MEAVGDLEEDNDFDGDFVTVLDWDEEGVAVIEPV